MIGNLVKRKDTVMSVGQTATPSTVPVLRGRSDCWSSPEQLAQHRRLIDEAEQVSRHDRYVEHARDTLNRTGILAPDQVDNLRRTIEHAKAKSQNRLQQLQQEAMRARSRRRADELLSEVGVKTDRAKSISPEPFRWGASDDAPTKQDANVPTVSKRFAGASVVDRFVGMVRDAIDPGRRNVNGESIGPWQARTDDPDQFTLDENHRVERLVDTGRLPSRISFLETAGPTSRNGLGYLMTESDMLEAMGHDPDEGDR